jgi:hypothetical protein
VPQERQISLLLVEMLLYLADLLVLAAVVEQMEQVLMEHQQQEEMAVVE